MKLLHLKLRVGGGRASVQTVVSGLHNARYIDMQTGRELLSCMLYNGHYVKRKRSEGCKRVGGKVKMADAKRKREFERTRPVQPERSSVPALDEISWRVLSALRCIGAVHGGAVAADEQGLHLGGVKRMERAEPDAAASVALAELSGMESETITSGSFASKSESD